MKMKYTMYLGGLAAVALYSTALSLANSNLLLVAVNGGLAAGIIAAAIRNVVNQ